MKISHYLVVCFCVLLITPVYAISHPESDLLGELHALQSKSKSGVIHINDESVNRFLRSSKPPRPYWLLIFFDAVHLHDNSELQLKKALYEFKLLASSLKKDESLFLCYIEFKESQSSFAEFGVETLPNIRLVGPDVGSLRDSLRMDSDSSTAAESMAEFVESSSPFSVGPIPRPPILSRSQLLLLVGVVSAWAPFLARRHSVLLGPTVWLSGSVFVYFFSVSGAMHNIIRKMPMVTAEQGRVVYFYQGSGVQLGAEGFAIGFLYTIVGLMLALLTHFLVTLRNASVQRGLMLSMLLVSFWAVRKVVVLDNWKTGYAIHAFWPSRWN